MIVRPSRPLHSQPRHFNRARRAALIAASAASVLLGTVFSLDAAAQASAASAPAATSDATAVTQYSVKPGQSLSDIATQITGSTDRATREKMARALFDANPNAFMGHDPSRLKLGSVLNVPQVDEAASASAASVASAPAAPAVVASSPATATAAPVVAASVPETTAAPAGVAASATGTASGAEVSGAVTASTASGAAASSEASPASSASETAPVAASVPASAPVAAAVTPASTVSAAPTSGNGSIGWIIGVIVAIGLLLIAMKAGKHRRTAAAIEDDPITPEQPVVPPAPEVTHTPAHDAHSHPATGAADLEGVAVQRGQGELNAVAASMENYDAAQSFDTPTEDTPLTLAEAHPDVDNDDAARVTLSAPVAPPEPETRRAPFMPDAPAALHRDFTPPRPGAVEAALAAERAATERAAALEQATREAIEREAAVRELEAKEAAARETAEREAQQREAERLAAEAREAEAREAATREAAAREAEIREAEARETALREAEAQAAAAREASEREAEAHAAPPADHANAPDDDAYDDEPSSPASRLPQPKFPQEAIEALSALDFGLPPRREASFEVDQSPTTPESPEAHSPDQQPELVPAAITPQPIADPAVFDHQNEQHRHPDALSESPAASVAQQIETGTAGAASVAGLGASRFGPLSLDFDYDSPSSQTEPLPAFTPEQIATIARNKLELAVEYIELGDLSGARTLLQEVIESNDPATRQPAATLLSTLAPLS
jgi:FimV-like protein